ncbi:GSAP-like protein [Mya arenaria]|uniref:GSAP-like protein n=1 Tax=Mya arenaria TaxID=6604 RepID=A0ABY7FRV0_MYAAR|nr:GSAP-like protein [Mya arenaria]
MLDLKKIINISGEINERIVDGRKKLKLPASHHAIEPSHLLNQERDGSIVFTWDDISDTNEGAVVTHFGMYNPVSKHFKVVHVHNQRVSVVSASISQDTTFIAFTTMSRDRTASSLDRRTGKETYSAYLAEIKAMSPRVFSLNLERQTFIKVQFLYEDKPAEKEANMIVMLHRESIGLYKIPLARAAHGMVMKGQPKTEQIGKKFVWCQWDSGKQMLFYIHQSMDDSGAKQHILSSVQMYNNGLHDMVLDVPLNFPLTSKSSGRCTYADIPLCSGIPASTIHGCVSHIPAAVVRRAVVAFSWLGDQILVMLPGYFAHLLNVSIEYEPCNHILLHSKSCEEGIEDEETGGSERSTGTRSDDQSDSRRHDQSDFRKNNQSNSRKSDQSDASISGASAEELIPVLESRMEQFSFVSNTALKIIGNEGTGAYLLDRRSRCVYSVTIDPDRLLFSVICNDIASPEVPTMMKEFLIAMTYVAVRRQTDREVLRLLPFTNSEPFRGQIDKTKSGDRLARLSYSQIHRLHFPNKTGKERTQKKSGIGDDWLDILRIHLRSMQVTKTCRWSFDSVKTAYQQMQVKEEKHLQTREEEHFLTLISISKAKERHGEDSGNLYGTKMENVLGQAPCFLQGTSVSETSDTHMALTREVLSKYLMSFLMKDGKVKAGNVSKEAMKGGLDEYELFQLLDRYVTVTSDLFFPVPARLHGYLTSLAFRALHFRMFLQYVDHGVLQLTGDFMAQLLKELPDNEEYVGLKHSLISRLPLRAGEECYRLWDHVTCSTYLAHKHVDKILAEHRPSTTEAASMDSIRNTLTEARRNSIIEEVSFRPLAAFFRHLEKTNSQMGADRVSPLDFVALEEVALHHTHCETKYDMGNVNF